MFARWLYSICFTLLLPAVMLRLLWRSRKAPDYRLRWRERFGKFPPLPTARMSIWIHAVSVGETLAAIPLIKALRQKYPLTPLVVTTTTPTGSARVRAIFANEIAQQGLFHVYAPYDLPHMVYAFLKRAKPKLLIIMETELWPNVLEACGREHIPVILANARLSEKSARGYRRIMFLTRNMLKNIHCVAAQHQADGERFLRLGLDKSRLVITGSIKFDLELNEDIVQQALQLKKIWGQDGRRLIWLSASTHPGEDQMVLNVYAGLKKRLPELMLVLVPRHPERFDEIYSLCVASGFRVVRRSQGQHPANETDIVLGDTMGELMLFYGLCDVTFVGGSTVPIGGHNLVEPAIWGKAVVSGEHLYNFSEISRLLLDRDALKICHDEEELLSQTSELFLDASERMQMGERARQVALENRGALNKLLLVIDSVVQ